MSFVIRDCIDQPIFCIRTDQQPRQDTASLVSPDVGYVRYPTLIRSIRIELSLEPVRRHDTDLTFTYPWAPVSDLSHYSGMFHQSPDSVDSALLSAVPQIQMDLAITTDASLFQPELFNLSCQSQIYLMAL
jgi:hypothetical protein